MPQFDVVIKDGTIFDGRRNPRFKGDIAVKDGRIAAMGRVGASDGARVIDASGMNVAPGFIDLHTHYDSQLFWDPYCSTSGWHGITSVVIGNCGFGFAPVRVDEQERAMLTMTRNEAVPLATMQAGMPWDWVTFPEFLDSVDRTPKSVNVLAYVPLNPLMVWTMGLERAKSGVLPTDDEHAAMCELLDGAMDAGARGVSTQRMGSRSVQRDYDGTPMASDLMHDETMLALAGVLRDRNDGFIQYTYVDFGSIFSGEDTLTTVVRPHIERVAEMSGRPIIVGGAGEADWGWLADCHRRGLRIYGQGATVTIVNPPQITNIAEAPNVFDLSLTWCEATVGSIDEVKAKFADPAVREKMQAEQPLLEMALGPMDEWVLLRAHTDQFRQYDELPLGKVAAALGKASAFEAFCDINIAEDMMTKWYLVLRLAGNDDEAVLAQHKAMADDPFMIPGISDGGAHTKYATAGHYPTRYLMTYVREHGWHSLEEAHWRLSALPAYCAGFRDRGVLAEGAPADIVVYDYENLGITEREIAHDYPGDEWRVVDRGQGYRHVLVNGEVTIEDDKQTDAASGQLLRNGTGG